jgi:hypothetical protein
MDDTYKETVNAYRADARGWFLLFVFSWGVFLAFNGILMIGFGERLYKEPGLVLFTNAIYAFVCCIVAVVAFDKSHREAVEKE